MKIKKLLTALTIAALAVSVSACGAGGRPVETDGRHTGNSGQSAASGASVEGDDITERADDESVSASDGKTDETENETEMKMNVTVNGVTFTATLEDSDAVRELVGMMKNAPVSIEMSDYSGFEKVGSLGRNLTVSDSRTTTGAGDIVLYNGDNIVMFYGSNTWSYTRIGHIDDLTGWEDALGGGDVTAVFTLAG